MVVRWLVVLATLGATPAVTVGGGEAGQEVERLQGAWKPVRLERRGAVVNDAFAPSARFVVTGNTLTLKVGDRVLQELHFQVGRAAAPRAIDLTSVSGPTAGQILPGIYLLDGKRLTLCWPLSGGRRPAGFNGAGDEVTLTLERD